MNIHPENTKILVVAHDDGLSALICKRLVHHGFPEPARTHRGQEAEEWLCENSADLMLLDFKPGDMSGNELLQRLEKAGKAIPFIVITGHGDEQLAVDMMKRGAYDYMLKGSSFLELLPATIVRVLGQIDKETRLQEAEMSLRRSEERYSSLIDEVMDGSTAGIVIIDAGGEVIWISRALEEFVSVPKSEAIGKSIAWTHGKISDAIEDHEGWQHYVKDPDTAMEVTELELHVAPGVDRKERWLQFYSQTIQSGLHNGGRIEYCVDISDRVQALGRLKISEEQLQQAQRMEAIGRLAGGIAHDFNNLLAIMLGNCELMLTKIDKDHPAHRHAVQIQKTGARAANLTRQLLAVSRKQLVRPTALDLNEVLGDVDKMLRRLIGEDITMVVAPASTPCMVHADSGQLEQVIINLAVNAKDSMLNGGKMIIESKHIQVEGSYADNKGPLPGSYIMLTVTDTGMGMDQETIARIFEPFFTTKDSDSGTGLGLSTVYGIVKQNGGDVLVYSEYGIGSTFKVYWPELVNYVSEIEDTDDTEDESADTFRGSETVLVVEDEVSLREIMCDLIKSQGHTVLEARHSGEAISLCDRYEGEIHLVVTDVIMPGMNGRQLADTLVRMRPDLKVLYISGYTGNSLVFRGILDDGSNFLEKPFSLESLQANVHRILGAEPIAVAAG